MEPPRDRRGKPIQVGSRVRLLHLSGTWLDDLSFAKKSDVLSMIGEAFLIEEIDEQGNPWISKWWQDEDGKSHSHLIALAPQETELLDEPVR